MLLECSICGFPCVCAEIGRGCQVELKERQPSAEERPVMIPGLRHGGRGDVPVSRVRKLQRRHRDEEQRQHGRKRHHPRDVRRLDPQHAISWWT